ncbi:MAG: hypothetical protein K0S12_667 [Bacteroidetes bacterium]|jgi:hypothetical protein|nr:hypothetical protein [Bacteroidota bacterium]
MKKIKLVVALLFVSMIIKSQDSSKVFSHEIGFNTVSLIKQAISNNPTSTIPQLPYDFFYNMYYKEKIGLRTGFGISTANTETSIMGQPFPRKTKKAELDYRIGGSYNFVSFKRVTLNAFLDYAGAYHKSETVTTTTVQSFPNPVANITTETSDVTNLSGVQTGIGIKYNIHKHLSLYTEMPLGFYISNLQSSVSITESGVKDFTKTTTITSGAQVFIPATIYLVLRF